MEGEDRDGYRDQIVTCDAEPLLCYMNSGYVLECRDTPISHSVFSVVSLNSKTHHCL